VWVVVLWVGFLISFVIAAKAAIQRNNNCCNAKVLIVTTADVLGDSRFHENDVVVA
jgi:hypothetical protein